MRLSVTRILDAFLRGEAYQDRKCAILVSTGKILLCKGQPIAFRDASGGITTAEGGPAASTEAAYIRYIRAQRAIVRQAAPIVPSQVVVLS